MKPEIFLKGVIGGLAHGSMQSPKESGTFGGNYRNLNSLSSADTSSAGGVGGSRVLLNIGKNLILDGLVDVSGGSGNSVYGGAGGAGGSVLIQTRLIIVI